MQETLKIIISTVSGFIVAFFAEPIKLYIQHLSKKYNVRRALYHELVYNYDSMSDYNEKLSNEDKLTSNEVFRNTVTHLVRTNCFDHYVVEETDLFYQLKEATTLNGLYATLGIATDFSDKPLSNSFDSREFVAAFIENTKEALDNGALNKPLFMKLSRWVNKSHETNAKKN